MPSDLDESIARHQAQLERKKAVYELVSAIAPGSELELAEALPDLIEMVRLVAEDSYECYAELYTAANAILAKLGLNETGGGNATSK